MAELPGWIANAVWVCSEGGTSIPQSLLSYSSRAMPPKPSGVEHNPIIGNAS